MKRSWRTLLLLASIPVGAGMLTVGLRSFWDRWIASYPVLDCPARIDLGERDLGEIAVTHFKIMNRGRSELLIDEFHTSCSCAGVEHEIDGKLVRLRAVRIPAGDEVQITARVAINQRPEMSQLVHIDFNTNDPVMPVGNVDLIVRRVKGGVFSEPSAVVFQPLLVGTQAERVIDLYDNRKRGRAVDKVRSTRPDHFQVRFIAVEGRHSDLINDTAGGLIARIEVIPRTEHSGRLDGNIEVSLANEARRPDLIPVIGEVIPIVECWPDALVFPRRAGAQFIYSAQILVRDRDEKPIGVKLKSVPPGVVAKIEVVPERDDQRILQVNCNATGQPMPSRPSDDDAPQIVEG
jgi:hypothetical protein